MRSHVLLVRRAHLIDGLSGAVFGTLAAVEWVASYCEKRDALQTESDALAQELVETYSDAAQRIYDVFTRAVAFRERAARILGYPPPQTEPLRRFDLGVERLLDTVRLFDFKGEQAWPPPSAQLGVSHAETTPFPSHIRGVSGFIGPAGRRQKCKLNFSARARQNAPAKPPTMRN